MSKHESEIVNFLKENVTPMKTVSYGTFYRASAYLTDGTYLPCVMFGNPNEIISLASRRFAETAKNAYEHRGVVESFVAKNSTVPIYNISKVELSPYAWPEETLREIRGETTMGWTAFTAKMRDGKVFGFGTRFNFEFFDLPQGYSYEDIVKINSGKIVDPTGVERDFTYYGDVHYYRDRPFFYSYSDLLPEK
ncbi:MAG: hypothetical protein IPO41_03040 [Acidobacteria bacterium]|nr:hypothetical protein [Acidobacteriota bacterium]MBP7476737.1 hypothetical protein [Pyrinomonadaceae bacterium]